MILAISAYAVDDNIALSEECLAVLTRPDCSETDRLGLVDRLGSSVPSEVETWCTG